jgi:hypothetical protein
MPLFRHESGVGMEFSEDHTGLAERNGFTLVEEADAGEEVEIGDEEPAEPKKRGRKPKETTEEAAE